MGCDIHMQVDRRVNGKWARVEKLPERPCSWCGGKGHYEGRPKDQCYSCKGNGKTTEPYSDRNYRMFSVLAGVRNDGNVKPIAEPRGLPADATVSGSKDEYGGNVSDYEYGDHSFSWLTLREVEAYDWKQPLDHEGFVNAENFKAWDEGGRGFPKVWCSGVRGGRVVVVSNSEMRRRIKSPYSWEVGDMAYTLVQWTRPVLESAGSFLTFVETLHVLGDPDDVRLVFGFDS